MRYEFIANTSVENGISRVLHAALSLNTDNLHETEARERARVEQAGALETFASEFEIWKNKAPALKVMQTQHDGRFRTLRQWVGHLYMPLDEAQALQQSIDGVHTVPGFPDASQRHGNDFEADCFQRAR